ncbi:MAG: tetratricopeptide repeat protein, partial [Acidobacteriota bacterium]
EIPNDYQFKMALAQAYLGLKQFDKAWPELESARMENPESSDVYLYRGIYYYNKQNYDKAVEDLEKSIKLNTENAYAYYYAGMSYLEKKMPAKMVEVFRIFLELVPGAPEAPEVKILVDANC